MLEFEFEPILHYSEIKTYKYATNRLMAYQLPSLFWPDAMVQIKGHCGETQLSDEVFVELDRFGILRIFPGYKWDGPSGPTFDTPSFMRGSLLHDILYQLIREGHLDVDVHRLPADDLLIKICKEDGMNFFRRWRVKRGVNIFGRTAASKKSDEKYGKVLIVP